MINFTNVPGGSKNEVTLHFAEYLICLFTPDLVTLFHTVAPSGES